VLAATGPSSDSSPMPGGGYLGGLLRDAQLQCNSAVFSRPARAASRGHVNGGSRSGFRLQVQC